MLSLANLSKEQANREHARGMNEIIPYMLLVTRGLVLNKNGSLTALFDLDGVDLEGKTQARFDGTAQNQEHAFGSFDERITVDQYVDHRTTDEYPAGEFDDPVSRAINDTWRLQFVEGLQYRTRLSLAVTYTPPKGSEGFMDRIAGYIARDGMNWGRAVLTATRSWLSLSRELKLTASELDTHIQAFEEQLGGFFSAFDNGRIRRLENELLLGALYRRINLEADVQRVSPSGAPIYLDSLLSANCIEADERDPKLLKVSGLTDRFVAALTVKEWPSASFPGMLDHLLAIPGEFVIHHSFRFVSSRAADDYTLRMEKHHQNLAVKFTDVVRQAITGNPPERFDDGRIALSNSAADARASITAINQRWGWYHFSLLAIGKTREETERTLSELKKALNKYEVVSIRESMALLSTYAGSLPGNQDLLIRWFFFSTAALCDLIHSRTVTSGSLYNEHYSKQAREPMPILTAFPTQYNSPAFFSTHLDDLAHALIVGPPGAGKTVFINFLLSQFRKYPGGRAYVFDKDNSCRITTLIQGGSHINLMAAENRGRMNPYALLGVRDSAGNLVHFGWLLQFTIYLLESLSETRLSAELKEYDEVENALSRVATFEPALWRLSTLSGQWNDKLKSRISPWVAGQDRGHFFDNATDSFEFSDFTTIEMGTLLERDQIAAVAVLDYAVYRISQSLSDDSTAPTVIYIEEVWFMLRNPQFEAIIENWVRVLRKKNAMLWFATQALAELAGSNISAAILNSVPTRIYCANEEARSEQNYKLYTADFGLNDTQVEQIQKAQRKTNYLLVQGSFSRMVWARFEPTILACLRSDKLALKLFTRWYAQRETQPDWQLHYIEEICNETI